MYPIAAIAGDKLGINVSVCGGGWGEGRRPPA